MNQNPEDKQLDDALARWGQQNSADRETIDAAKDQTLSAWKGELANQSDAVATNQPRFASRKLFGAIAIAAAVLIGCFLASYFTTESSKQSAVSDLEMKAIQKAAFIPEQQRELLTRFRELFGDQLSFVSDVNDDVRVSLDHTADTGSPRTTKDFVAVQIVLLSRESGNELADWRMEHRIKLLSRPQQRVDVQDRGSKFNYSMWTLPVEENLLSIDLQIRFAGQTPIVFTKSELQISGDAKHIHTFTQSNVEYRVYQTGVRLDGLQVDNAAQRFQNVPLVLAKTALLNHEARP